MTNFKVLFFSVCLCLIMFSSCSKVEQDDVVTTLSSQEVDLRSTTCTCTASLDNITFPTSTGSTDYWGFEIVYTKINGAVGSVTLDDNNLSATYTIGNGNFDEHYTASVSISGSARLRIDCDENGSFGYYHTYNRTRDGNDGIIHLAASSDCSNIYYTW